MRWIKMLSITECKRILNRGGILYSDAEVEIIRMVLYQIAEMQYQQTKL